MSATIELIDSRTLSETSSERKYFVDAVADEQAAYDAILAGAPSTANGLALVSVSVDPVGLADGTVAFFGTAKYAAEGSSGSASNRELQLGEASTQISTASGTAHITRALCVVDEVIRIGDADPNLGGTIGVTESGVDGVDVVIPTFNFSKTKIFSQAQVTASYLRTIFQTTGSVNSDTFLGFYPGEVLFLGANATQRISNQDTQTWEIVFNFAARKNETMVSTGELTLSQKNGWDIIDVYYKRAVGDTRVYLTPSVARVLRVYPRAPFSPLGFTGGIV